jgi:radical SAM superfamily enzyme YgiQ (UPF0313 family)
VVELIDVLRPRIVGISALTSGIHMAYRLCRHVKAAAPHVHTVVGGPHGTALPEEVLSHPEVDFVVRGEGEQTMVELTRVLFSRDKSKAGLFFVSGISFRNRNGNVSTQDRAPMDFDSAPLPARHLVPMANYLQQGAIVSSRGCTYRCWFCSSVTFNTHKYRYRSNDLVMQEMDLLRERYGTRSFEFIEDTFTCMPDRILSLTGLLRSRDYEWSCQATIPDLNEHPALLPSMVEAGCRGLFFGIESGNDEVLKKIKHMSRKKILGTIDRARTQGVKHFVTSFIIGHPWDTREAIADTLDLILELRARGAHTPVSILVPFPGSPIAKWPEKFGITIHSVDWADYYYNRALISTSNLCREELDEIYFSVIESVVATAGTADAVGEMSRSRLGGEVVTN